MENVIPIKEKTTEEKLQEARIECAKLFQNAGSLQYEIDCLKGTLGEVNIKLRNANLDGIKLEKALAEEKAAKEEPKNENN